MAVSTPTCRAARAGTGAGAGAGGEPVRYLTCRHPLTDAVRSPSIQYAPHMCRSFAPPFPTPLYLRPPPRPKSHVICLAVRCTVYSVRAANLSHLQWPLPVRLAAYLPGLGVWAVWATRRRCSSLPSASAALLPTLPSPARVPSVDNNAHECACKSFLFP